MGNNWTREQQQVIDLRDCNMLVSAAAGSGKTAVLVERIISRIMDKKKPVDIDRLLVVTFTNAAAAEMRERISAALEERLEQNPEDVHLQRQNTLVHHAQITTIHSFCLDVIRNHFDQIHLDPGFRIGDEGELKLMRQDVMENLLEEEYREGNPDFLDFAESIAPGKTDRELEGLLLQFYDFSMGYPWPRQWREKCRKAYELETKEDFYQAEWMQYLTDKLKLQIQDSKEQIRQALAIAGEPDGPYLYADALQQDLAVLSAFEHCETYGEYADVFKKGCRWAALSRKRDASVSEQKKSLVKEIRDQVKKDMKKLEEDYFFQDADQMMADMRDSRKMIDVLLAVTEKFQTAYEQRKAEKNLVDFNDLEHFALQILVREEEGEIFPTETAREYAQYYQEVMIDEYQDSNLVQEILLSSVSKNTKEGYNRFMVGDVKQSIYRFRLARPELFMEKYHDYTQEAGENQRIDLHRNFRSRSQVLDGVNLIFRQIMTRTLGGVEYDDDAALYPGAVFEEGGREAFLEPELWLVSRDGGAGRERPDAGADQKMSGSGTTSDASGSGMPELTEEEQEQDLRRLEAMAAAERILQIVGREPVWDKEEKKYRPARYSDIVVLLRTVSGWADEFSEVFSGMGIPSYTGTGTGYFTVLEVKTVLAFLKVLDNPRQDVPLAAVLRSPIGKLTDEELAALRIQSPDTDFYTCCVRYLKHGAQRAVMAGGEDDAEADSTDKEEGVKKEAGEEVLYQKLKRFWDMTQKLRELVPYTPMHLLLWRILEVTGYGDYVTAMPGGAQRKANLDMLVEKAVAYESTSYRGLFNFVRYMENLQKYQIDYGEASLSNEAEDTVRIMSIHKSKGLEFPVVLLCGLGKSFNQQDTRGSLVLHPSLGVGCDYVDLERRIKIPLLIKKAIGRQTREENLGEELRVLYVAMTRAKEKLILMGGVKDTERSLQRWSRELNRQEEKLSYTCLTSASTYLDWIMPALLRHPSSVDFRKKWELPLGCVLAERHIPGSYQIRQVSGESVQGKDIRQQMEILRQKELLEHLDSECTYDEKTKEYFQRVLQQSYPYERNLEIPGKMTVSELKRAGKTEEASQGVMLYEEPRMLAAVAHVEDAAQVQCVETAAKVRKTEAAKNVQNVQSMEPLKETQNFVPIIPRFRKGEEAGSGAARGTVYHRFLENLDFTGEFHRKFMETQLETMIKCGKILKDEARWISRRKLEAFLDSDMAKRMQRAAKKGLLYREQPFVLGVGADQIRPDWDPGEQVLIQGIIDAYFYEDGEIVLLDYKTDQVPEGQAYRLADRYRIQLDYYQLALERLTGKRVKERVIYSFCLGEEIRV